MDATWLGDMAAFALPSGFLGAVVSWMVGRRRRNNDFLGEMQRSIDLLSEKYNAVLQDNVALRCERADWQVRQQELDRKIDRLAREVKTLRRELENRNHEQITYSSSSRRAAGSRPVDAAGGFVRGLARPDAAQPAAGGDRLPDADDLPSGEPS